MTAHELLISLFWLVALAYALYIGWFTIETLRSAKRRRTHRQSSDLMTSRQDDHQSR